MIYINDFLIIAPTSILIVEMKDILVKQFELKNLNFIKLFFEIWIIYDRPNQKIYFNQNEYIKKILDKFDYSDLNGVKTPWPTNIKFLKI